MSPSPPFDPRLGRNPSREPSRPPTSPLPPDQQRPGAQNLQSTKGLCPPTLNNGRANHLPPLWMIFFVLVGGLEVAGGNALDPGGVPRRGNGEYR
ncbi:hypothetical protein M231_04068 [Tremella mesenterica]|uniref:Uncharacterized protein n=1 Tax=Tremella mesenterica TaxID=5217 RepID=A0A4Q1BLI2_TREME|nr:hypothetical protein M231_04068 [Tremella mesenterica]